MAELYCPDCRRCTNVVSDHSTGDMICTMCALVVESHSIDETPEGRTFAHESGDSDLVRVDVPCNPLLTDGSLSTFMSKPNGAQGEFLSSSLGHWENRGSKSVCNSQKLAFQNIGTMSNRLGLVATIKERACEIYKNVVILESNQRRNRNAILAACLYIACREEHKPRTLNEIFSVANCATIKKISQAKKYILELLELNRGQFIETGTIHAGDFLLRFCSNLGMSYHAVKAAQEAVQKCEELDIRRSPISITAAVIYMISQLSGDKKSLSDVSVATGVAMGTIRNSYKDLYPYASKLIPRSFSKEQELRKIWRSYYD